MGNVMMIGDRAVMVVATGSMGYKNEANDYLFNRGLNNQFQQYDIIVLEKVEKYSKKYKKRGLTFLEKCNITTYG